jgi:hypothetical protein
VAAARDFLTVRAVLRGDLEPDSQLEVPDTLRWDQGEADRAPR